MINESDEFIHQRTPVKPPSTMKKKTSSLSMANSSTPPIPNDIIVEILSWISVSSLMRFRWTCKYWFDLITRDHAFSKLHLLHQHHQQEEINDHEFINNNSNTSLLIFASQHRAYNMKCSDVFRQSSSPETVLKMDFYDLLLPVTTDTDGVRLVTECLGSCNGLICFHRFSYSIDAYFLWNPSTRELKELPQPPNNISCTRTTTPNLKLVVYGFGYDHTIDDYKVIQNVYYHVVGMMNNVYTLGSNSWQTKNETVTVPLFEDDGIKNRSGLFANGALHLMIFPERKAARIITFDITKEEHGEIHCPEVFSRSRSKLRVLNESLWVFHHSHSRKNTVDVWIMKDYGVKESWTKSFTMNLETLISIEVSTRLHPVKYFKDSGILMLYDSTCLVAYDTKNCKIRYIQKIEYNNLKKLTKAVVTYVESLVSLDSGVILNPDGSTTTTVVQVQEGKKEFLLRSASGVILTLTDQQEQQLLFKYMKEKKEPPPPTTTTVAQVQEGEKESTLLQTDSGEILTLTDQEQQLFFKYMKEKMKEKREPTTTTKKRPRTEEEEETKI